MLHLGHVDPEGRVQLLVDLGLQPREISLKVGLGDLVVIGRDDRVIDFGEALADALLQRGDVADSDREGSQAHRLRPLEPAAHARVGHRQRQGQDDQRDRRTCPFQEPAQLVVDDAGGLAGRIALHLELIVRRRDLLVGFPDAGVQGGVLLAILGCNAVDVRGEVRRLSLRGKLRRFRLERAQVVGDASGILELGDQRLVDGVQPLQHVLRGLGRVDRLRDVRARHEAGQRRHQGDHHQPDHPVPRGLSGHRVSHLRIAAAPRLSLP